MILSWNEYILSYVGIVDALYLGKWKVGHVAHSFTFPEPPDGKYTFYCNLPGVPCSAQPYADAEKAKQALENIVRKWMEGANERQTDAAK
ncbi:hypothetical protein [Leclercia sp.]|uniref:hypothetical protein n=1 Tax=Leclercia sp. TaxID=1898428 RepID=UPI002FDE19D7